MMMFARPSAAFGVLCCTASTALAGGGMVFPGSYSQAVLESRSGFATAFNIPESANISDLQINDANVIAAKGTVPGDSGEIEDALFVGEVGSGLGLIARTGSGTLNPPAVGASVFEAFSLSADSRVLTFYFFFGGGGINGWHDFEVGVDATPQFLSGQVFFQNPQNISESFLASDGTIYFSISSSLAQDGSFLADPAAGGFGELLFLTQDLVPSAEFDAGFAAGSFNDNGQQAYTRFIIPDPLDASSTFAVVERATLDMSGAVSFDLITSVIDLNTGNPGTYQAVSNGPDINNLGHVAFLGVLFDGDTISSNNVTQVIVDDGNALTPVVTEGVEIDGVTFDDINFGFSPRITDTGLVLFSATDSDGTTGLWVTNGTSVTEVVAIGDTLLIDDLFNCDGDADFNETTFEFVVTALAAFADINNAGTVIFSASNAVDGRSATGGGVFTVSPGSPFLFFDFDYSGDASIGDINTFLAELAADNIEISDVTGDCEGDAFDLFRVAAGLDG